jgi:hypothetical protein
MDIMLGIVINHDFANSKTLDMLLSYERRIESSLYRAIAELKKLRQAKNTENRTQDTVSRDSTGKGWHPPFGSEPQGRRQAELGDGKEIENGTGTNEPNLADESSEGHPHPDKSNLDDFGKLSRAEAATQLEEERTQETESDNPIEEDRNIQAISENCDCANEANLLFCNLDEGTQKII